MFDVKITAVKKAFHRDLAEKYQKNMDLGCDVEEGQAWISRDCLIPDGFCPSAWENLREYVFALSTGGGHFFVDWMKNPYSALISCNDGIRPVSFLLERM
ncbi:MAG: TIGR04076 family protein [Candidatus Ornithospirochaeta sp.]